MSDEQNTAIQEQEPVTQPEQNADTGTQTEQKAEEPYKSYKTKDDFDNHAKVIKTKAESDAKKAILSLLGLTPDQESKLSEIKKAYEDNLTEAEKQKQALAKWQQDETDLRSQLAEKDQVIAALMKVSGKSMDDVAMYVNMAKGLVSSELNFEQAFDKVLEFTKKTGVDIPKGKELDQPDTSNFTGDNPFVKDANGKVNLGNISRLVIQDPKTAAVLAKQANYPITWRY